MRLGVAFTTRADGNLGAHVGDDPATVARNRAAVEARLGISGTTWCEQVHGTRVTTVAAAGTGGTVPQADGLVTTHPGAPLAVVTADCLPLLMADAERGVVAAVHTGRRGLAAGIVRAAVAAMRAAGARDISAVIGPAIGPCCYEVGRDVQDEVAAVAPSARATTRQGTPALDLAAGVRELLAGEGVTDVDVHGGCTAHQPERYFSHRRDGATGRQAGYVWLEPA